jgi:hypothetical protein
MPKLVVDLTKIDGGFTRTTDLDQIRSYVRFSRLQSFSTVIVDGSITAKRPLPLAD